MRRSYQSVVCKDGFTMSVQAGNGKYSQPRTDSIIYESVEVGYPSHAEPLLFEYMEFTALYDEDYNIIDETEEEKRNRKIRESTNTVYGWVPADIILKVIDIHGGQVGGELPPLVQTI